MNRAVILLIAVLVVLPVSGMSETGRCGDFNSALKGLMDATAKLTGSGYRDALFVQGLTMNQVDQISASAGSQAIQQASMRRFGGSVQKQMERLAKIAGCAIAFPQ